MFFSKTQRLTGRLRAQVVPMANAADPDVLWEVALSDDERKSMTLAQLDDALRLGVVDKLTLVRQHGTTEWQALHVVAKLDPDARDSDAPTRPMNPIPPAPKVGRQTVMGLGPGGYAGYNAEAAEARRPLAKPETSARALRRSGAPMAIPRPGGSAPPPPGLPPPPAAPRIPTGLQVAAAAPPPRPGAPPSRPPPAGNPSVPPPGLARPSRPPPGNSPAASRITAQPLPVEAALPEHVSLDPTEADVNLDPTEAAERSASQTPSAPPHLAQARPSRLEWLVLGIAALAAGLVSLQRLGRLHQWSSHLGIQAAYLAVEERTLGGPEIDTPRGVKRFLDAERAKVQKAAKPKAE